MKFVVMKGENLPNYFIIGTDNIHMYDIRVNVQGRYFTLGNNLKRKFELVCCKPKGAKQIQNIDNVSNIAEPEVPYGRTTKEPKEFEEALKESHWDSNLPTLGQ